MKLNRCGFLSDGWGREHKFWCGRQSCVNNRGLARRSLPWHGVTCRPARPGCAPQGGQPAAPWCPRWAGPCSRTAAAAPPATAWPPAAPRGCPATRPQRQAGHRLEQRQQPAAAAARHQPLAWASAARAAARPQREMPMTWTPCPGLCPRRLAIHGMWPTAAAARAGGLLDAAAVVGPAA